MSFVSQITIQDQTDIIVPFVFTKGNNSLRILYNGQELVEGSDYIEISGNDGNGKGLIKTLFPLRGNSNLIMSVTSSEIQTAAASGGGISGFLNDIITIRILSTKSTKMNITISTEDNTLLVDNIAMNSNSSIEGLFSFDFKLEQLGVLTAVFNDPDIDFNAFQYITIIPIPEGNIF